MKRVTETDLPGVGVRLDIETDGGGSVGVVVHQTGRRDLVIYDEIDPDRSAATIELSEEEGHTLGEVLGATPVIEHLEDSVHRIDDLAIAWVGIDDPPDVVGRRISDAQVRTRTGAGIVAVISEGGSTPVPGGDHILLAGDTAIVIGLPEAVEAATALLAPIAPSG